MSDPVYKTIGKAHVLAEYAPDLVSETVEGDLICDPAFWDAWLRARAVAEAVPYEEKTSRRTADIARVFYRYPEESEAFIGLRGGVWTTQHLNELMRVSRTWGLPVTR